MWTSQYDIIVETLTGNEFEVTVTDKDTVGYIKSRIQKYEGIPVGQQHILYNQKELNDATEMKDIPVSKGSRFKLVLGMKGGPVSARRVVTLPDYDSWFDLNDILNNSRQDPLTISTSGGVKLLVYKDCKKNIHRVMKFRAERKNSIEKKQALIDPPKDDQHDEQWLKDNIHTMEKMHQLRTKLDSKKKNKISKIFKSQSSDERCKKPNVGAIGDRSCKKDTNPYLVSKCNDTDTNGSKTPRRLYFPPCKAAIGSPNMPPPPPSRDEFFNGYKFCPGILNKHGIAKTFIRPPSITTVQQQERKSPTPPCQKSNDFTDYFNLNNKFAIGFSSGSSSSADQNRSKIRDNIRRNRSFKTINASNLIIEENNLSNQGRPFSSVINHMYANKPAKLNNEKSNIASMSVHDLIEKFSSTSIRATNNKSNESLRDHQDSSSFILNNDLKLKNINPNDGGGGVGIGNTILTSVTTTTAPSSAPKLTNPIFENKLFLERQQSFTLNGRDKIPCSGEYKMDNTPNTSMDNSFRLYKMAAEGKNCYELPKLLIREDSPVESFHSSDPQLETIALRGESPKTVVDTFSTKLDNNETTIKTATETDCKGSTESIIKTTWNHHHSDLGLNNLELNFLNDELSDCEGAGCLKKSSSVLKIASNLEINKWKSPEFESKTPHAATSLNFVNGDISSSDEEDAFNSSCELLHTNSKSKSVELNEFRMMFGSSPTLLNYNPVTQTSRLDAVPFQYRRGYSNLNDACLSSSTSDLECFHGGGKKSTKCGTGGGNGQEYSSLLRHRNNGHFDYVRSYENLDRTKIVRMKNDKRYVATGSNNMDGAINSSKNDWKLNSNFDRERIQTDDSTNDFSYYNLGYDNTVGSIGFPVGYQSNESLFNIASDALEDDVFEIDTLGLFESVDSVDGSSTSTTNNTSTLFNENKCDTSTFILPEITNLPPPIGTADPTLKMSQKSQQQQQQQLLATTTSTIQSTSLLSPSTLKKPQKLRCAQCNKKLGVIMIMKCHCEKIFCAQHRYAETHNCSYNFKLEGKEILARENPQVIAPKLPKI